MVEEHSLPQTFEDAIKAGFRRFEDLPTHVRDLVQAHDETEANRLELKIDVCAPGHTGPCSTTNYPDGTRKICYCTAARQCDQCAFEVASG